MNQPTSAHEYVQLFKANVARCVAIPAEERANLLARRLRRQNIWLIARGTDGTKELVEQDPAASSPFELVRGGRLSLEVRVGETGKGRGKSSPAVEVVEYRFSFLDLPTNDNSIRCLRFDKPQGQHRGDGWEEHRGDGWEDELGDNPRHPWSHLHINFAASEAANDYHLPTGPVCPILLLRAFNLWYFSTFMV